MTRFTKMLLAGTASVALLAAPALAGDPALDMTGSSETTGSLGSTGTDPAILLTQRGYTRIELADTAALGLTGHATYKARNSAGKHVELLVDTRTGDVLRATTKGAKK